jgi:hypothetical protein
MVAAWRLPDCVMVKRIALLGFVWCVFLAASGFAQGAQIFGDTQSAHLRAIHAAIGWNAVLAGGLRGRVDEPRILAGRANTCGSARLMLLDVSAWERDGQRFREVPVWQLLDRQAFFFISGMTIDADGSPNAYHPHDAADDAADDTADDAGLDELANAGKPGDWNGIITDRDGDPLIQQERDPYPGYYISCTSLSDKTKTFTDPTRYVDASKIPYVVLPQEVADRGGARLGDFAVVVNLGNGKSSFAIYADIGTLGEGSVALANALGIQSDARHGGESDGILYLVFPGSGNRRPRTIGEIQSAGEKLLMDQWDEMTKVSSCVERDDPEGNGEF